VTAAQRLVALLDSEGLAPRAALWVYEANRESWRLWIVPPKGMVDKRAFYLQLAKLFAARSEELPGLDLGEVQFMTDDHPAIVGLGRVVKITGVSDARLSNNVVDGYFIPEAIVIRMAV
jgi:hypothetical protein